MIVTLKTLIRRVDSFKDAAEEEKAHKAAMDLAEALLRHLAVVAVAAYRHAGHRDPRCNQAIAKNLPWPSMGSWKNILDVLANADEAHFPAGFHGSFLAPLKSKRKTNADIERANGVGQLMLRYAADPDPALLQEDKRVKCTPLGFLDLMVQYRNEYEGHTARFEDAPKRRFLPFLNTGLRALCHQLRPVWIACPVYRAVEASTAGARFHKLHPLVEDPGVRPIETQSRHIQRDALYVLVDPKREDLASMYPIALWKEDDILFLNGSRDFGEIKYLGYSSAHMEATDKHNDAFCNFILGFMGGHSLSSTDLADARVKAQAETLGDWGWQYPRLRAGAGIPRSEPRYELVERIGEGGMAVVWKAISLEDRKEVALKILRHPEHAPRFRREARALERFSAMSERIVRYFEAGYDPHPSRRIFYMAMELYSRESLDHHVGADKFEYERVVGWMDDALEALGVLHGGGVVHRDVKPANLMFRGDRVVLGDLGLVGQRHGFEDSGLVTSALTRTGDAMGTFEYCSPEQIEGEEVEPPGDVYSLGAAFYHLLTNQLPFGRGAVGGILSRQRRAKTGESVGPKPVHELREDCPVELSLTIMEMIQFSPESRPSVPEVRAKLEDVRRVLRGEPVNINFNIMGQSQDEESQFADLTPTWYSQFLYVGFPLGLSIALAACWVLAIHHGVFHEVDLSRSGLKTVYQPVVVTFLDDWLIFLGAPVNLILVLVQWRARRWVGPLMRSLQRLDTNRDGPHWKASQERRWRWRCWDSSSSPWAT